MLLEKLEYSKSMFQSQPFLYLKNMKKEIEMMHEMFSLNET